MCASVMMVPAGNPEKTTLTSKVAAVMFPLPSRVVFSVSVAVPLAPASALLIGGTSLVDERFAVNTNLFCAVGAGAGLLLSLLQPAATTLAVRASIIIRRDMCF